jgi:hypothetical protein
MPALVSLKPNTLAVFKPMMPPTGEPLWLSGEVEKNENINEIERPRVRSPPQATSFLMMAPTANATNNFFLPMKKYC